MAINKWRRIGAGYPPNNQYGVLFVLGGYFYCIAGFNSDYSVANGDVYRAKISGDGALSKWERIGTHPLLTYAAAVWVDETTKTAFIVTYLDGTYTTNTLVSVHFDTSSKFTVRRLGLAVEPGVGASDLVLDDHQNLLILGGSNTPSQALRVTVDSQGRFNQVTVLPLQESVQFRSILYYNNKLIELERRNGSTFVEPKHARLSVDGVPTRFLPHQKTMSFGGQFINLGFGIALPLSPTRFLLCSCYYEPSNVQSPDRVIEIDTFGNIKKSTPSDIQLASIGIGAGIVAFGEGYAYASDNNGEFHCLKYRGL